MGTLQLGQVISTHTAAMRNHPCCGCLLGGVQTNNWLSGWPWCVLKTKRVPGGATAVGKAGSRGAWGLHRRGHKVPPMCPTKQGPHLLCRNSQHSTKSVLLGLPQMASPVATSHSTCR